jgi:PBSX family phage terminase large subunit
MGAVKVGFEVSEAHLPLFERTDWRYGIIMGGRGNGRSGTASRYSLSRLFGKEYTRGALMRAVHSDIRTSSWAEIQDRLTEQNIERAEGLRVTDGDMFMEYGQNSLRAHGFKASSGSLTARLKSLANYNFIWGEEGEEIGEQEFITLDDSLRTTKGKIQILLTLNTPPKSHWIIKRFFDLEPSTTPGFYIPRLKPGAKDVVFIGGNYRDNLPNLDPHTVARYEAYRETKPDYYWQMIEGLCPEVVLGRIYSGWKMVEGVPHEARLLGYGLDFGFDPDPAAIVAIYWYNGGFILDEKLYQTQLLNDHLAASLKALPKAPVVADSAEPKSIADIAQQGVSIIPCEKGADSVDFGIKHVQGLRISYTRASMNLHREYENYAWKVTKDGENAGIEDPKCPNHLMSAARYALSMFAGKDSMYDPEKRRRDEIDVSVTRRRLTENGSR